MEEEGNITHNRKTTKRSYQCAAQQKSRKKQKEISENPAHPQYQIVKERHERRKERDRLRKKKCNAPVLILSQETKEKVTPFSTGPDLACRIKELLSQAFNEAKAEGKLKEGQLYT
jgi:hypothetical protein